MALVELTLQGCNHRFTGIRCEHSMGCEPVSISTLQAGHGAGRSVIWREAGRSTSAYSSANVANSAGSPSSGGRIISGGSAVSGEGDAADEELRAVEKGNTAVERGRKGIQWQTKMDRWH